MFLDRRCIIFDLDGTLIDSLGIWSLVDCALVEELSARHVRLSEEEAYELRVASLSRYGEGSEAYVRYCADLKAKFGMPGEPEEIHRRRYEISRDFLRTKVDWRPGAVDVLRALKGAGVTLAIATTTRRRNLDVYSNENLAMREAFPIAPGFAATRTRDEVTKTKPDPEAHFSIMEELGLKPSECLVVEDAASGLTAAHAAGIDAVVVSERHSEADRAVNDALALRRFENHAEMLAVIEAELQAGLKPGVCAE